MDFELEQIFAKVSGENREIMAVHIISDTDKAQIDFAFNEIFSGLSLSEWMLKVTLDEAWKIALDKLRDFVFSINEQSYMVDYLRHAVFDFKKRTLRNLESSIHANEYIQCPADKYSELEESANTKIQNGIDILRNLLANPAYNKNAKINTNTVIKDNRIMQRNNTKGIERERIRK